MKKTIILAIAILLTAAAIFTACGRTEVTETTTVTEITTECETITETETTQKNEFTFEEIPEAEPESLTQSYEENREIYLEFYEELGIDYLTAMAEYEITDEQMVIKDIRGGKIGSIFVSKEFLKTHEVTFEADTIEKYTPEAVPDGEIVEGPHRVIFESDLEVRQGIRWTGELKIKIDGEYTVIIDPEN